jgi:RimJ/RimL family protein N-acetyltransferase
MSFELPQILENESLILYPLKTEDFEDLYQVASDPAVWAQHPNKDRWKKEVFQNFFKGALESGGAFKIIEKSTNRIIGSTRFYDYSPDTKSILIGYTYYSVDCWGQGFNPAVKAMMLDYIFQYVDKVYLHVGATNFRSQVAVGRLGAEKVDEQEVTYFGEAPKLNFIYLIRKEKWNH